MSEGAKNPRLHTVAALAALVLSACGGGGDPEPIASDPGTVSPPASAPSAPTPAPPASSPPPAPAPAPSNVVVVGSDTQAEPNMRYEIVAPQGTGTVGVTLPQLLSIGDTVAVTGVSDTPWELRQNAGQTVATTQLPGNQATGQSWAPQLSPRPWWWLASNAGGDVLTAGEILGSLFVSTDGGSTWTERMADADRIWIGTDMTPDGQKIVALAYNDRIYISNDRGETWTPVAWAGFSGIEWESVAISADGNTLIASALARPLYVSTDGGATWTERAQAGSWRGVAMSADGTRMVAIDQGNAIYTSSDAGLTWAAHREPSNDWYRVASSDDGQLLAAAERFGGAFVISRDGGATWTPATLGGAPLTAAEWTTVAISADGRKVAASASGSTVYLSEDGGSTFSALPVPAGDSNWRSVALSADGNMMLAATGGAVGSRVEGQLYTSRSNRTAIGTLGSIGGGQNDAVEVEYLGDGRFRVLQSSGGPFSIR